MKKVSVVIPFKGEKVLLQLNNCINSLLYQTVLPLEVILVGDLTGIKNRNQAKIKLLSPKIVKHIPFQGDKNNARNLGIEESRGDFVIYLDHDMTADNNLIKDCINKAHIYDALIIPEKGAGGNFWENCKKLERQLITYDLYTVTPRFYKKSIFKKDEKPFDSTFGLLDEWGFNNKLRKKKVSLGYSESFVVVKETNFSIRKNIINKFQRGLWMKNFYRIDKEEARRRIDPIKRGIVFYGQRLGYLLKDPIYFTGLVILKMIDFVSFMSGYFIGNFIKQMDISENTNDLINHYDAMGESYIKKMYETNSWTRYVDTREKETVRDIWPLKNSEVKKQRLLDLGMGPGRWSEYFIAFGIKNVYGLDLSPVMVEHAKQRIRSRHFKAVLGSMDNLPFEKGYFDKVFCFRALKYAGNSDMVLKEIYRVLKPGGSFLLEVSNNSLSTRIIGKIAKLLSFFHGSFSFKSRWGYFSKSTFYNKDDILDKVKSNNFKVQTIKPLFTLPSIPLPSNDDLVFLWIFLDEMLSRLLPKNLFCRSWIILATKKS